MNKRSCYLMALAMLLFAASQWINLLGHWTTMRAIAIGATSGSFLLLAAVFIVLGRRPVRAAGNDRASKTQ